MGKKKQLKKQQRKAQAAAAAAAALGVPQQNQQEQQQQYHPSTPLQGQAQPSPQQFPSTPPPPYDYREDSFYELDELPGNFKTDREKRMWRIIAMALTAVIVIVIVVVVAVVVTNHKNNNQASNSGSHAVSKYANLTRMTTYDSPDIQNKKRIFVVGDIHGCVSELNSLVDQIKYNSQDDLLILAGDLVDRGPDSLGVIRRAQELGALCVRGNHDDKVVRLKTFELQNGQAALQSGKGTMPEGPVADPLKFSNHHAAIALAMSQEEYNYLAACPMILRLPWLSNSVVVHGGLDPTKDLESQDPYSVMNMRDIADGVPNPSSDQGVHWGTAFNSAQLNTSNVMYVYYGHDAGRGLNLQKYTKGVDTGCVYGRKLTALEMRSQQLTQVSCSKYA